MTVHFLHRGSGGKRGVLWAPRTKVAAVPVPHHGAVRCESYGCSRLAFAALRLERLTCICASAASVACFAKRMLASVVRGIRMPPENPSMKRDSRRRFRFATRTLTCRSTSSGLRTAKKHFYERTDLVYSETPLRLVEQPLRLPGLPTTDCRGCRCCHGSRLPHQGPQ